MREPDYDGFWKALPEAAMSRDDWDINEGFRRQYREEIVGVLNMLHRLGLVWGATALHPQPPRACDLCQRSLHDQQIFADGLTEDSGWAVMCAKCFFKTGLAVGPLAGQLYLQVEPGKWRLVVGSDANGEDETTLSLAKPLRRGLGRRFRDWFRSSSSKALQEKSARTEPRRPMRCGTPYIWMGARVETDRSGPGSVLMRGQPSRRPTYKPRVP